MIPQSMKKPIWLIPACILSLTGGIFIMMVYFLPELAPRMHANMFRRGLHVVAPWVSGICISVPVFALWYHSTQEERVQPQSRKDGRK